MVSPKPWELLTNPSNRSLPKRESIDRIIPRNTIRIFYKGLKHWRLPFERGWLGNDLETSEVLFTARVCYDNERFLSVKTKIHISFELW